MTDTDKTEADGGAMTRLLIKLCSRARWHVGTLGRSGLISAVCHCCCEIRSYASSLCAGSRPGPSSLELFFPSAFPPRWPPHTHTTSLSPGRLGTPGTGRLCTWAVCTATVNPSVPPGLDLAGQNSKRGRQSGIAHAEIWGSGFPCVPPVGFQALGRLPCNIGSVLTTTRAQNCFFTFDTYLARVSHHRHTLTHNGRPATS